MFLQKHNSYLRRTFSANFIQFLSFNLSIGCLPQDCRERYFTKFTSTVCLFFISSLVSPGVFLHCKTFWFLICSTGGLLDCKDGHPIANLSWDHHHSLSHQNWFRWQNKTKGGDSDNENDCCLW